MALPTDLGATDVGFLLEIVDFRHLVRWNGTAWDWAAGDEGNGFIRDFLVLPSTAGWQLCDGTVTSMLRVGFPTLYAQTIATPNETSGVYHKSGATTTGAVAAAVAAAISGSVAAEAAHTHSIDPPSTTSGVNSASETVDQVGGGATVAVAKHTHTHDTDIAAFASAAGSSHVHAVGSLVNDAAAEPAHVTVLRYFRR